MQVLESGKGELIQPYDLEAFREWNRNKSRQLVDKRMTEEEAVSRFVTDGCYIGTELYGTVRCRCHSPGRSSDKANGTCACAAKVCTSWISGWPPGW